MANAYVTLDTLKGTGGLNLTSTAFDSRLLILVENVCREIDRYLGRHCYYVVETRYYDGKGGTRLNTPDLISLSSLKEDTNVDGTFETTWAGSGTDYHLWPYNSNPTAAWDARPYQALIVNIASVGTQDEFFKGQRNYELAGTWGYSKVSKAASNRTGTVANATATSITLGGGTAGTVFEYGQTILIGNELCYANTAITATATTLLVERAVNGSTGTAHTGSAINIMVYPGPVQEAALMQTARLWKRKDSAFATEIGMPETGQILVFRGLDPDVKQLLAPYRRLV